MGPSLQNLFLITPYKERKVDLRQFMYHTLNFWPRDFLRERKSDWTDQTSCQESENFPKTGSPINVLRHTGCADLSRSWLVHTYVSLKILIGSKIVNRSNFSFRSKEEERKAGNFQSSVCDLVQSVVSAKFDSFRWNFSLGIFPILCQVFSESFNLYGDCTIFGSSENSSGRHNCIPFLL